MAKNDQLHNMAKQLLSKAGKKKPVDNVSKSVQKPKKVAAKSAPKPEPKMKAAMPPKAKPAPHKAASKNLPKKAPMKAPVAKAAPKAKTPPPISGAMKAAARSEAEAAEHAAFGALKKDMPMGGKAMKMAGELAPSAASKAEMAAIKSGSGKTAGRLGKLVAGSMVGAALAGPVGFGLQALMEGLDAEDAGDPNEARVGDSELNKGKELADKAINRQAASAMKSGRLKPPSKHADFYGKDGPSPQQKMEDDYAKELKKYPR